MENVVSFWNSKIKLIITIMIVLCAGCAPIKGKVNVRNQEIQDYDVIIVGAGYAGLTSAFYLKDYRIKVLEKKSKVGGRALRGMYNGLFYAKGAEYMGEPTSALKKISNRLDINLLEIPFPMDAHYRAGRFHYGASAIAAMHVNDTGVEEYNRFVEKVLGMNEIVEEYIGSDNSLEDAPEALARLDKMTAREWFVENGFSNLLQRQYNVASRGLFGANIDEVSALMLIPEIGFDFVGDEDMDSAERFSGVDDRHEESYVPMGGTVEIPMAIAEYLGDRVQVDAAVKRVFRTGSKYSVVYESAHGKTHTITSDVVILAVPAPVALKIANDILNPEQKSLLKKVKYSVYCTVALFSDEPIFNSAFDLAMPEDAFFTDLYDGTWVQKHYDEAAGKINKFISLAYVAPKSHKDKSIFFMPDKELLSNIYKDLNRVIPGASLKVTGYDIHRFKYAYPIMEPGDYAKTAALNEINVGPLLLAGDYMLYPTFEAAAESGKQAALEAIEALESR